MIKVVIPACNAARIFPAPRAAKLPQSAPLHAVIGLSAALDSYGIAATSLWDDQAFSFFVARHGPAAAAGFIKADTQPPLSRSRHRGSRARNPRSDR